MFSVIERYMSYLLHICYCKHVDKKLRDRKFGQNLLELEIFWQQVTVNIQQTGSQCVWRLVTFQQRAQIIFKFQTHSFYGFCTIQKKSTDRNYPPPRAPARPKKGQDLLKIFDKKSHQIKILMCVLNLQVLKFKLDLNLMILCQLVPEISNAFIDISIRSF